MSEKSSRQPAKPRFFTVNEVVQKVFTDVRSPLGQQFTQWQLWFKWKEIVGPSMAEHSLPVGIKRGTLFIWVKSSAWLQQMSFMAEAVKDKINQHLGKKSIHRVKFTLDRKSVPQKSDADPDFIKFFS